MNNNVWENIKMFVFLKPPYSFFALFLFVNERNVIPSEIVYRKHDTISSGASRIKKVGGPLRGQGKSRGANVNVYLAW